MMNLSWDSIRPAPASKGSLIEPEATDRHAPYPWMRLPPGGALILVGGAGLLAAGFMQTSVRTVRREGFALPGFTSSAVRSEGSAAPARRSARPKRNPGQLHRALAAQVDRSPWSREP